MLAAAAVLFVAATWMEVRHPHWAFGLLVAMAEAAMIGGLADWFAVVALFRHPLGQRWIPHTAIIPNRKDALGRALADFICNHFLEPGEVMRKLDEFDPASRLAVALSRPENAARVGRLVVDLSPHLLALLDSERLHAFLERLTREQLRRMDVAALAGQVLEVMTHQRRHQALLDSVLRDIAGVLTDPGTQETVAARIAPQLWSVLRLTGLDEPVARRLAERVVAGVGDLVDEMASEPDHELRLRFDHYAADFVARLRSDPALQRKVGEMRDRLLDDPALPRYVRGLWDDVLAWLRQDLLREDSEIAARAGRVAMVLGERLSADTSMRDWLNGWLRATVEPMVDRYRGSIRDFIVERVGRWDTRELVDELELSVGSDLQYIRYNGTAIGALIGGVLFGIVQLIAWLGR
ncbi:hypothetical protein LYB30171_01279 [Lysobacter luteus]|uniref:DUF445 domain-containing protein n=2 Tax=Novilysobacter luteus TaxID=2822368 RepID=A0ABM8UF40_9GAMM|nr:hypothetical protein LYB30171_01279 [Lysobacter luteus]